MPKGTRTGCRPRHTLLVMNSALHAYFCRATLVHNFRSSTLSHPECAQGRKPSPGGPAAEFHPLSDSRNVPSTAVDSTFQVLLCSGRNGSFVQTAQTPELLSSPFGATVRVRR